MRSILFLISIILLIILPTEAAASTDKVTVAEDIIITGNGSLTSLTQTGSQSDFSYGIGEQYRGKILQINGNQSSLRSIFDFSQAGGSYSMSSRAGSLEQKVKMLNLNNFSADNTVRVAGSALDADLKMEGSGQGYVALIGTKEIHNATKPFEISRSDIGNGFGTNFYNGIVKIGTRNKLNIGNMSFSVKQKVIYNGQEDY